MTVFSLIKRELSGLPPRVRVFLYKVLLTFIGWKLLYHLILVPTQFPNNQLTKLTAISTAFLYQKVSGLHASIKNTTDISDNYASFSVYLDGGSEAIVGVGDPCNGLELFVLYTGFLFCIPERLSKKIIFIVAGTAGIYVLNVLRCAGIAWLNLNYSSLADFAHHYLFKLSIYGAVFYTWTKFSKNYFSNG